MTVMVATSPSLHVQSGPRHFAEAAITHFGGLRDLESGVGHLTETRQLHGCVRYALTIPLVTVNASLRSATGQCVVAGRVPRLVISGDFLEDSLADQFDRLQQVVRSGTSLLVDAKALRSALLHFLHAPTNRACVSEAGAVVPGVSPAYAVRARQLVGEALGQVFSGTLLRYMVAGLIVAPFVYLLAHRIFGLSPADALPYGAVPPLLAYVSAVVSNRLTLRSLTSDPAFQASLKQAADSR